MECRRAGSAAAGVRVRLGAVRGDPGLVSTRRGAGLGPWTSEASASSGSASFAHARPQRSEDAYEQPERLRPAGQGHPGPGRQGPPVHRGSRHPDRRHPAGGRRGRHRHGFGCRDDGGQPDGPVANEPVADGGASTGKTGWPSADELPSPTVWADAVDSPDAADAPTGKHAAASTPPTAADAAPRRTPTRVLRRTPTRVLRRTAPTPLVRRPLVTPLLLRTAPTCLPRRLLPRATGCRTVWLTTLPPGLRPVARRRLAGRG